MPFEPFELEFRRSDVSKVVKFFDKLNGQPDWIVNIAKVSGVNVDRTRWTFINVRQDPDPTKPEWMEGTLVFNPAALTSAADADRWLRLHWPTSGSGAGTLELTVGCNQQPRPLTIKLKP